jgi:hypothetical protein
MRLSEIHSNIGKTIESLEKLASRDSPGVKSFTILQHVEAKVLGVGLAVSNGIATAAHITADPFDAIIGGRKRSHEGDPAEFLGAAAAYATRAGLMLGLVVTGAATILHGVGGLPEFGVVAAAKTFLTFALTPAVLAAGIAATVGTVYGAIAGSQAGYQAAHELVLERHSRAEPSVS